MFCSSIITNSCSTKHMAKEGKSVREPFHTQALLPLSPSRLLAIPPAPPPLTRLHCPFIKHHPLPPSRRTVIQETDYNLHLLPSFEKVCSRFAMGKLSSFHIFYFAKSITNYVHATCLFLILSAVQYCRVSWALSMRETCHVTIYSARNVAATLLSIYAGSSNMNISE